MTHYGEGLTIERVGSTGLPSVMLKVDPLPEALCAGLEVRIARVLGTAGVKVEDGTVIARLASCFDQEAVVQSIVESIRAFYRDEVRPPTIAIEVEALGFTNGQGHFVLHTNWRHGNEVLAAMKHAFLLATFWLSPYSIFVVTELLTADAVQGEAQHFFTDFYGEWP